MLRGRSGENSTFKEPETTDTTLEVCRKSGNPAFKGLETLDMALDSLHKNNHTHRLIYRGTSFIKSKSLISYNCEFGKFQL